MKGGSSLIAIILVSTVLLILLFRVLFTSNEIDDLYYGSNYNQVVEIPVLTPLPMDDILAHEIIYSQSVHLNENCISFDYPNKGIVFNRERSINNLKSLFGLYLQESTGTILYPDYYGGAYIDGNGHLVLLSTDLNLFNSPLGRARQMSNTRIQLAIYSFNEMMEVVNLIQDFISTNPEHPISSNIMFWEPNIRRNRVIVGVLEHSQNQINAFKELVIDSSMISFDPALLIITSDEYIPIEIDNSE